MEPVGQVIGTTSLRGFRFVIKESMEEHVKRDEFVCVKESVTGKDVLGIVKEITISNELLPDEFGRDMRMDHIVLNEGEYPVSVVKVLGFENNGSLEIPRHGIQPGVGVYLADDEMLKRLLRQDAAKSAHIGTLSTRDNVSVYVSINELISRHCAVLAMTGAGKSYTVGVLVEEIMKKRGSVVLFDPHGEFKDVRFKDSKVRVYGIEGKDRITVAASTLTTADFSNLIPDLTSTQRDLLDEVLTLAYKFYDEYDLSIVLNLLGIIYDIKKDGKKVDTDIFPSDVLKGITQKVSLSTVGALIRRISRLERMRVFQMSGTSLNDIVCRNQLTVINLSEADEKVSETIVSTVSRGIFSARKRFVKGDANGVRLDTPVLIIVEEAHNFAPRVVEGDNILSKPILRKIAREGRKFGVGLCVVSQRPNKLDADILSQCNTQIIMKIMNPSDQEYIRQSVETVTEDIVRDLPSLARGEAIVVGAAVNLPVPVKIRPRETEVRGEDIDIVGAWNDGKL
ncbi:MAG: ATP-binding protein [Candidatus Altiarchaeota archaeon]